MFSFDMLALPLLGGVGTFALVGLVWNLFEAYYEERRKNPR